MKDSNSKMKWDNPYRVKMGRTQISLSQLNSSNIGVGNVHSTVTDLMIPTPTPFLTFNSNVLTHQFVYRRKLDNSHQKTHDKILKLKNDGLGYRRISKELNRLGYKSSIGKEFYPSLISVIWKKIEKTQKILSLLEKGKSVRDISGRLGVSTKTVVKVRKYINTNGVLV